MRSLTENGRTARSMCDREWSMVNKQNVPYDKTLAIEGSYSPFTIHLTHSIYFHRLIDLLHQAL